MIQALQDQYDVGLMCWEAPDFGAVNRAYGTELRADLVRTHLVSDAMRRALAPLPFRLALLRWSLLVRAARRVVPDYDVLLSAENEVELGRPAIQYVHYPRQLRPRPTADLRWYHRPAIVVDAYYALSERLTHVSFERMQENLTLANSTWTADRVRERYHIGDVIVAPPPVAGTFPEVPWDARENGFLCIGRFAREKNLERVIGMVDAVRRHVPEVHLHLVGGRASRSYFRRVERLAKAHASWVHLDADLPRDRLIALIAQHRYGLHGMDDEHFGIAPAEMVRGGCIVFVPNNGGQVDIVGSDARLVYDTPEDGVAKIVRTLSSPDEQTRLRTHLAAYREAFSAERFMTTIRDVVARFR
jgi:glycosyltransferase involved in cell wall biosynthesis